jgi:hypothetical protein
LLLPPDASLPPAAVPPPASVPAVPPVVTAPPLPFGVLPPPPMACSPAWPEGSLGAPASLPSPPLLPALSPGGRAAEPPFPGERVPPVPCGDSPVSFFPAEPLPPWPLGVSLPPLPAAVGSGAESAAPAPASPSEGGFSSPRLPLPPARANSGASPGASELQAGASATANVNSRLGAPRNLEKVRFMSSKPSGLVRSLQFSCQRIPAQQPIRGLGWHSARTRNGGWEE